MKKNCLLTAFILINLCVASCSRKVGCPTNGTNVGAERLMSGEKLPKVKKFKA